MNKARLIINLTICIALFAPACTSQPPLPEQADPTAPPAATFAPSEGATEEREKTEESPVFTILLNGLPFAFTSSPHWDGETLWLPAKETFQILEMIDINFNKDDSYISAAFYNHEQKHQNCHYSIGETSYSPDTEAEIWLDSPAAPYIKDNEVFLPVKMIEDCFGKIVTFHEVSSTIELTIPDKSMMPLQINNHNPYLHMVLKDDRKLEDTRIGSQISGVFNTGTVEDWIGWSQSQLKKDGFTRARITLNAIDGGFEHGYGDFTPVEVEFPAEYIALYQHLKDLGIKTRYTLTFWDLENRQKGGTITRDRLSSEQEIERYLAYVEMVVTSLKGKVDSYELWNEPDANREFFQRIRPEDYIEVTRRAVPLIREIDPQAKMVLVSTSSYTDENTPEYSMQIIQSDVIALADIISLHTVNNDASPVHLSEYYYGYDKMWEEIKKAAESNGFSGEYVADELNYRSNYSLDVLQSEPGDYNPSKPEIAAKYIGRMIVINLGLNISVGTSGTNSVERPIEGRMIRNLAYTMDNLAAKPLPVMVRSDVELFRHYTFEDRAGNAYIAIWNDTEAKVTSDDLEFSLIAGDIAASSVIAFDPYYSTMQTMNYSNTDLGVELNGLVMRDYPVIYKITKQ